MGNRLMRSQARPLVMFALALSVGVGLIPEEFVTTYADTIVAGVLAVWAMVAAVRNKQDKRRSGE